MSTRGGVERRRLGGESHRELGGERRDHYGSRVIFIEVRATFSIQGVAIHTNDRHFVRQRSEEQDEKEPETCHATREQTVESKTKCVADVGDSGRWEIVPVGARLLSVSEGGKLGKMEQGRVYLLTKNASK